VTDSDDQAIASLPILTGIDRRTKLVFAHMVPKKGHDAQAIKQLAREIKLSGYSRLVLKSDQEPSIKALIEAVKNERAEDIETLMQEESPVGEHQSNGEVENAIKSVQAQMRTMRLALQSRYGCKIRADHPIMPWLIKHAALLIDLCKVGEDGRTPFERRKGKRFHRTLPEFGECVWFLKPQSVGKDKLDPRWEQALFVGMREESGEILMMNENGVIKVRTFMRKAEEERWNQEEFAMARGTPWEPIPGRSNIEVKSHFTMKDDEVMVGAGPVIKESKPRRIYITRHDIASDKYGITPGCKGCEAINRGTHGQHEVQG